MTKNVSVCKYRRTSWEECDPTTNMRVMVKTLKRGDPAQCEPTQSVERKCKGKKNTNGNQKVVLSKLISNLILEIICILNHS